MSIQDWDASQQPREKLLSRGPHTLSNAELLAIFLRTGAPGINAVALGERMLAQFGTLRALFDADFDDFDAIKGVGQAKFVQLQAILELSKRYFSEQMKDCEAIDSPAAVRAYLQRALQSEPFEQFWLVHLDNQHRVLDTELLFKGTIDSAAVYPRVVINSVIKHNSAAVIFAHNHPSGVSEPSQSDIQLTRRLQQALNLIDVRTLDHFVIGHNQATSFAERGLL